MTTSVHLLEVSRPAFGRALQLLRNLVKKETLPDAVISFDGDEVTVSLASVIVGAPAKGTWSGCVIAPGAFFVSLAKESTLPDPLILDARDKVLRIGPFFVECSVETEPACEIALTLDAPLIEILEVAASHPGGDLRRAGLKKIIDEANEQAARIIETAARVLEPLDIDQHDLRRLLERRLKAGSL
jgi:hypothetical protein